MDIDVKVKDRILNPVSEVFDAVVNPDKLSKFFISRASGPIKEGESATWFFDDVGGQLTVKFKIVHENELISLKWAASGVRAQVDIIFTATNTDSTSVIITEKAFHLTKQMFQKRFNKLKDGQILYVL